ncbi:hypothetical protein V5O48_010589 [Marasmius crinis-equi]|uniref:HD domain-containing protein n=1 Tax=Marasmius crinis-equi TaxID=585013 RepID=A0ABR3F8J0_9AGAR
MTGQNPNTSFEFEVSADQKDFYEKNGYLVLPATSEDISKNIVNWTYEVKSLPHRSKAWMHYDEVSSKGETTLSRTENFANYHDGFNNLFRGGVVLDILKQLSGEDMVLFKEKINYKAPWAGGYRAHLDATSYAHVAKVKHLSILMAVEPATLENGCLEVVAGSHKLPESIPVGEDQCITDDWCEKQTWVPVPLETGQFLVFGSYLAHRSASNQSPNGRAAIYATYNALSEGGDQHDTYYANRRKYWPATADRVPGDKYENGAKMYAQGNYIGEPISQLEHSLQAAECAKVAGSEDEVILAALLHDIGQFLPESTIDTLVNVAVDKTEMFSLSDPSKNIGRNNHEVIGAVYLSSLGFPRTVCELVRDHVVAKRYLTATEPGYFEALSEASKASLEVQGGPFTPDQSREFERDPLFREKVAMRRFDDQAKVVGLEVSEIDNYQTLAIRVLVG